MNIINKLKKRSSLFNLRNKISKKKLLTHSDKNETQCIQIYFSNPPCNKLMN